MNHEIHENILSSEKNGAICISAVCAAAHNVCLCAGMTDLLAPLLATLDSEVDAFWCFEKLVEGTAYFKPANDPVSVEKQLVNYIPLSLVIMGVHLVLKWVGCIYIHCVAIQVESKRPFLFTDEHTRVYH